MLGLDYHTFVKFVSGVSRDVVSVTVYQSLDLELQCKSAERLKLECIVTTEVHGGGMGTPIWPCTES